MPTPSEGPIDLSDLIAEWGDFDGAPTEFSEYYAGGDNVSNGAAGINGPIPSTGTLTFSKFLGASDAGVVAFSETHYPPEPIYFSSQGALVGADFSASEFAEFVFTVRPPLPYVIFSNPTNEWQYGSVFLAGWTGRSATTSATGIGGRTFIVNYTATNGGELYVYSLLGPTQIDDPSYEAGADSTYGLRVCSSDTIGVPSDLIMRVAVSELGKVYLYDYDESQTVGNRLSLNTSFTENTTGQKIGYSIAMDTLGETLVACLENGTVKTYTRSGSTWSAGVVSDLDSTVALPQNDVVIGDRNSVRISGNGNWLVVGQNGQTPVGSSLDFVAVYERVSNVWTHRVSFGMDEGLSGIDANTISRVDLLWDDGNSLVWQTKNDWIDIDHSGMRVVVGDIGSPTLYSGRLNVFDATASDWSTFVQNTIDAPTEAEHLDPTFQNNAPWTNYNFSNSFRLGRNGTVLSCQYFPEDHSGATTNEIYIHTINYILSRPTLQTIPFIAEVTGDQSLITTDYCTYFVKDRTLQELKYDIPLSSEISLKVSKPSSESVPPDSLWGTLEISGDWGLGAETKTFLREDADNTTSTTTSYTWRWTVTTAEKFLDGNTYEVKVY